MPETELLDFIQSELDSGKTNQEIVQSLFDLKQTAITVRTLSRWISDNGLCRPVASTAMYRCSLWLDDVRRQILRGIPLKDILYHLDKQYNEKISLNTLRFVLKEVSSDFCVFSVTVSLIKKYF